MSDLARTLPRRATAVFSVLLDRGHRIQVNSSRVRDALLWLQQHNPLYMHVVFDEEAFEDIASVENTAPTKILLQKAQLQLIFALRLLKKVLRVLKVRLILSLYSTFLNRRSSGQRISTT